MKKSWFPIFIVAVLLGLLGLLATLQYSWLGQISDGDRERMQKRLETETQRFAEDFNREIQNAYFNFQMPAEFWRAENWSAFNERYSFWRGKTAYPDLIRDFYFIEAGRDESLIRYNKAQGKFDAAQWTDELSRLKTFLAAEQNARQVDPLTLSLFMPIYETEKTPERVMFRHETPQTAVKTEVRPFSLPKKFGVLVIKLDAGVLKDQILKDLVKKYFSESDSANYKLAIKNSQNETVFQTQEVNSSDASAELFDLSPDNFVFFANREIMPQTAEGERKTNMIYSRFEKRMEKTSPSGTTSNEVEVQVLSNSQTAPLPSRVRVYGPQGAGADQNWFLNVQHSAGSLEQFITNTRRKNLAISFGILSLLGISVVLIFLSAQRAKRLAQRQIDFVSSVSHEFRTPLAVIYSAGENLTDGVVRNESQILQYGNLIKREGKKLSAMVEQILEFAGARSGRRKYDFRPTSVEKIIARALAECQPLIDEKGFVLETDIAPHLKKISADETALSQAVQNLITNSLKYSNCSKWLKVTASNGNEKIKITVEDKGLGIAAKDLPHVFEPFFRAKAVVDEQIHGNGLGLSIVKQIVDAHKGRVKVESEIGQGSRFTIEIPQREISPAARRPEISGKS